MEKSPGTPPTVPKRPGKIAARALAGCCMGLGFYGVTHGLKAEESTLRITLSAVTPCCGIVLLRIPKTGEKENR